MSEDGKRGRVWTDGRDRFRRSESSEGHGIAELSDDNGRTWRTIYAQVAAMEGTVAWADEPKTLTPQEALRALADGKCIACNATPYRLGKLGMEYWSPMRRWVSNDFHFGEITGKTWRECPDPSQPSEPRRDWNPLGPYEDMPADIQRDIKTERGHARAVAEHVGVIMPLPEGER